MKIEVDLNQCRRMNISEVVFVLGLAKSKSEARRLIEQGGIRIEGEKVAKDEPILLSEFVGKVFQKGRRAFMRLAPLPVDMATFENLD